MQSNLAINVCDVTKIYRLYDKPIDRLKESISLTHKKYHKEFFALDKISFSVEKGSTVGIIGTNGSGKSTILKIITGVLNPTTGSVEVDGNISALLELGAGFNMDYTGIENIYMNGTMMGFSREQMEAKLPEILEFADIGDFVYQPVKTYSSGMFVRLAFALAINVEPEILIVDEALSVGDVFFQAKCYRRMEEIRKTGTTILMVTHDMGSVIKYCDKVILLNKGEFLAEGPAGEMVDLYKKILAGRMDDLEADLAKRLDSNFSDMMELNNDINKTHAKEYHGLMKEKISINPNKTEYGDGRAEIYDLGLLDSKGELTNLLLKGEEFTIREKIRFNANIESPIFTFTIKDKKGTELSGTNTMFEGVPVKPVKPGDEAVVEFKQKMTLQGGEYLLSMSCTGFENGTHVVYHRLYDVTFITVISNKNTVGVYDMESKVNLTQKSN
ncbi:MAG: ABC transporter ATP-binding protein [Lachnoanaerobaculum sp.]|jgi:putative O-antigen ABC transporter, ATP-binding protein|uniref:ABC transporter ATP-binding protein n=1 Tax=Lachnoanaerobaculum sp. TaxID=2049030 RepID=UPI001CB48380|nr:ABC transporter ATP-binding protein [Lachnoanaerobaculum sp.]MBF1260671.1 ABC transporter ATP-binding protein [Lachnoanaerobaculum sp.]MBS5882981.1 ABC transporter ATP-binding protein [Lachnoanaerobaculum sp.]